MEGASSAGASGLSEILARWRREPRRHASESRRRGFPESRVGAKAPSRIKNAVGNGRVLLSRHNGGNGGSIAKSPVVSRRVLLVLGARARARSFSSAAAPI